MKGLLCKLCGDLMMLISDHMRQCKCGNVRGHYDSNGQDIHVDVTIGNWGTMRIVGIDNTLLQNDVLPPYHGKPAEDGATFFHQWGSAIIIIPPGVSNDVFKMNPGRYPEARFWTEDNRAGGP